MPAPLEEHFHEAMLDVYRQAKSQCRYNATYFLQMVNERGGLQAARDLLHAPGISDGFTKLWECGRLDLTVESVVLQPTWRGLFSDDERAIAQRRLRDLGFAPPAGS